MAKDVYSVLVSLIALLLVLPIAGVNQNITVNYSDSLTGIYEDRSRDGDYDVLIEFAEGNEGLNSVTRNEEIQNEFVVTNEGTFDDTYDLSVTWDDEYDLGWYSEPDATNISVSSGNQGTISFTFRAPIQGVYSGDYLDFTVTVTSQNSTITTSSAVQRLEIDMIYAVDVIIREGNSQGGNRGDSVTYAVEATNVGETSEEFSIDFGNPPKDWTASTSEETITLDPDQTGAFNLIIDVPNTAAENEYAIIQISVHVQETGYDHIYGYLDTNTTVNDGREYGVDIVADAFSKQVIPGGQILYDLYVTNTGDETDSFILDLGDVREGWHANLSQFGIDGVGPDETVNIVLSVSCPPESVKDDWSLAYVSVRSSNREQFMDDLTTNTSVRIPIRDVVLTVTLDSLSGNPSSTVSYSMSLTNSGTDPDDFLLSIERCEDCGAWGVALSEVFVEDLGNGDSHDFEFYVEIPSSARNTDSALMKVVATSLANTSIYSSVDTTTSVNKVINQNIYWDETQILNPSDVSSFEITLYNQGNSIQSYTFKISDCPSGWNFENTFPYSANDLDPYGGTETFSVPFQVPDDESPDSYYCWIELELDESGITVHEFALAVEIEYYAEFFIEVIEIESFNDPGSTHIFNVDLTNNANAEDGIDLHLDGLPSGWNYCIDSGCVSSITVPKGETESFELKITSSPNEAANTVNGAFMSLVGVSSLNDKVTSFDTFTVYTYPVYQLNVEAPSGTDRSAEPGDIIPFQLEVTNNGNALDYVSLSFTGPWATTAFSDDSFTLDPSQAKLVYLNVEIPGIPGQVYGGDHVISACVQSGQSEQIICIDFVVSIPETQNIEVELKTTAGDVTAGTTGEFKVRLENKGNTIETLNLSIEGKYASWYSLPEEDSNGIYFVTLSPGDFHEFIIQVSPPFERAAGEVSGTLNVTLSSDMSTEKLSLPFTVLKSSYTPPTEIAEEESSWLGLPSPGIISILLVITIMSRLRRRI